MWITRISWFPKSKKSMSKSTIIECALDGEIHKIHEIQINRTHPLYFPRTLVHVGTYTYCTEYEWRNPTHCTEFEWLKRNKTIITGRRRSLLAVPPDFITERRRKSTGGSMRLYCNAPVTLSFRCLSVCVSLVVHHEGRSTEVQFFPKEPL